MLRHFKMENRFISNPRFKITDPDLQHCRPES